MMQEVREYELPDGTKYRAHNTETPLKYHCYTVSWTGGIIVDRFIPKGKDYGEWIKICHLRNWESVETFITRQRESCEAKIRLESCKKMDDKLCV